MKKASEWNDDPHWTNEDKLRWWKRAKKRKIQNDTVNRGF